MSRPFAPRPSQSSASFVRVNGKIRAREVRVIAFDGSQLGVIPLGDALNLARQAGVDLVEIAPNANPPVCKVIDFGKYRYELSKKEKESKKHQHGNKVKEIQLSANIDPHDFGVKLQHAINFLCEDMKVKITLRFRGREMAHKEIGFQQVNNFVRDLMPFANADSPPKLIGKGINVMLTPLPKNKRAKNPNVDVGEFVEEPSHDDDDDEAEEKPKAQAPKNKPKRVVPTDAAEQPSSGGLVNNPFTELDKKAEQ